MQHARDDEGESDRSRPKKARRARRPRAVVVEDEFMVLLSIQHLLESLGCEVVGTTHQASSAVDLVRSLRPDLVFMDLGLPDSDALAATRAITSHLNTRVVVITAYNERRARAAARRAGASRFLTKPLQEAELAQAISELTHHRPETAA